MTFSTRISAPPGFSPRKQSAISRSRRSGRTNCSVRMRLTIEAFSTRNPSLMSAVSNSTGRSTFSAANFSRALVEHGARVVDADELHRRIERRVQGRERGAARAPEIVDAGARLREVLAQLDDHPLDLGIERDRAGYHVVENRRDRFVETEVEQRHRVGRDRPDRKGSGSYEGQGRSVKQDQSPAFYFLAFAFALAAALIVAALVSPAIQTLIAPVRQAPLHRVFSRLAELGLFTGTWWLLRRFTCSTGTSWAMPRRPASSCRGCCSGSSPGWCS